MRAIITVLLGLAGPGLLPAIAIARRSPVALFLAPLIGAALAAAGAELELGIGGTLGACYLVVAVLANAITIFWWLIARRSGKPTGRARELPWRWSAVAAVTMLAAVAVPLTALRAHIVGWDSNSIWLTHALMISGGHHTLLTDLQDVAYRFSNPDYPPLVPAAGAVAFSLFGRGQLLAAIDVTVLLNACALCVLGMGVAAIASKARQLTRLVAIAAGGAVCLAGFAVAGKNGVDGHADLMWAAAAAAAIVWGLVLPRSPQALGVAWICAAAASLTKNEGFTSAVIVLVLIALRYRPLRLRLRGWPLLRDWTDRAVCVLVPALPGLAWAEMVRLIGLHDAFFAYSSHQPLLSRADATVVGMARYLGIVPVALAVLLAGCVLVRRDRQRADLGNPAWLWTAWLGSLAIIFGTYVFGGFGIQIWLRTSVSRTTIFAQVLLYAEIAIWLVLAADAARPRADVEARRATPSAARPEAERTAAAAEPGGS